MGDIIGATVESTAASGFTQMRDVALFASMAKNRRPGRTGYSPRSLVFGLEERLAASGLSHYLEQPDDASIAALNRDPVQRCR